MNKKLIIITSILGFLCAAFPAGAATLHFVSEPAAVGVGDIFIVNLLMDSPEVVNALQGQIHFPADLIELQTVTDGNSIVNFWIVSPRIVTGKPVVEFAGAIPGGFGASDGKIVSLRFKAIREGTGVIRISDALTLVNDGQGTAAKLTTPLLTVRIGKTATGDSAAEITDVIPPQPFQIQIGHDPALFDDRYFAVFGTQDKESGVAYYEIAEVRGVFKPTPWQWATAESPYELQDQTLRSWVFVKAVDMRGNEQISFIEPTNVPAYARPRNIIIGVIVIMLLLEVWRQARRRKR